MYEPTEDELAMVLCGLRMLQAYVTPAPVSEMVRAQDEAYRAIPLTEIDPDDIDTLCEKLNCS